MIKSRKHMMARLGMVFVFMTIVILGIAYAAFSQTLNINGSGTVRNSSWNIHFVESGELEPSNASTLSSSVKVLSKPSISATTVGDYRVSLTTPGDTIGYRFSVINEGDYNAKISNFNLPSPVCKVNGDASDGSAVNVCAKLDYSLTYENGAPVASNDTLLSKETKTFVLTLTYNEFDNANALPSNDVEISNLGFTINYVQDGSALVNNDGTTPYNPYPIGKEIDILNENYYVIGVGDDYVTLLKSEPLTIDEINAYGSGHVNMYLQQWELEEYYYQHAYNYNGYGGMAYYSSSSCTSSISLGCTNSYDLSEVKYVVDSWTSTKFTQGQLKTVEGYSARLISYEELIAIGYSNCSSTDTFCQREDTTPRWLYAPNRQYSYWTMSPYVFPSAGPNIFVWFVGIEGRLDGDPAGRGVSSPSIAVRPVINVYKSAITQ